MNRYPFLLNPYSREMIWGGNRMRDSFGYDIPSDSTGECWAISAHPNGDCLVETDEYKGKTFTFDAIVTSCPAEGAGIFSATYDDTSNIISNGFPGKFSIVTYYELFCNSL